MQFNLNEMQTMIQDGARRLLAETLDSDKKREVEGSEHGFSNSLWKQMSELGWTGASLPENVGGGGLGVLDLCILAEEMGKVAVSTPLVASSGLSANFLRKVEQTETVKALLSRLATSDAIIAPALIDEGGRSERSDPKAQFKDGKISGAKVMVAYASAAELLLVSCLSESGEVVVAAIDRDAKGVHITPHKSLGGHPLFHVKLDDVTVAQDHIFARGDDAKAAINHALDVATILATAEVVGNCEGMLLLSAEYAATREQFGVKIGSFQAVAHPIADMRIQTDAMRLLVFETAWMLDQGRNVTLEVSETKAFANESIVKMVHDGHAVHGAIGYTTEYDLQLYTRRGRAFCLTYGDTHSQTERAAIALGL